ncbi:peptide MFS transporter [Streptomyces sp. NBC_01304]|uniref:peptide MFS transporter n=1 Tax=Streptomyces sp. NBC_01304 TaxID=2903818 RepID=UPI002E0D91DB|nr:peptide MFS transporter [Streptomyces sp. NBC_01304]
MRVRSQRKGTPGEQAPAKRHPASFRDHPHGLATLALTEMWERFSLFGMVAILVHFFVSSKQGGGMDLATDSSVAVAGVYLAMMGLLALPGGWVADRFLGARRAVFLGGLVIMTGHICLAIPGNYGVWPGLLLIAVGTGLLKTNITSMVGFLYARDDTHRRAAGYSLYYMGISVGALIAPMIVGFLSEEIDWHVGFGASAVGMAIGLTQFALGRNRMADSYREHPVLPLTARERRNVLRGIAGAVVGVALLVLLAAETGALSLDNLTYALAALGLIVPAVYLAHMYRCPHVTAPERVKLKAYIWFFAAAALFWMIYDQMATTLNIFASQKVDLHLAGWAMPASWTMSFPSVYGIVLAPLIGMLWLRKGRRFSTPGKFSVALGLIGGSFLAMAVASSLAAGGAKVSLWWLVGVYFIQVVGELCLSLVGVVITMALAPRAFTSQMIGIWFLAAATGDSIGGQVPRLDGVIGQTGNFLWQGALLVVAGLLMRKGAKWLRTQIGEQHSGGRAAEVAVTA